MTQSIMASKLKLFLDSDPELKELYSVFHGYATALACQKHEHLDSTWASLIEAIDMEMPDDLRNLVDQEAKIIDDSLTSEEKLWLPTQPDFENELFWDWCLGFMLVVMDNETIWHSSDELIEMLIPILFFSKIAEDAEQFEELNQNEDAQSAMAYDIPELIIDIFLILNEK